MAVLGTSFITKDEFERRYARLFYPSLDLLHETNLVAVPCHCPDSECQGWQMEQQQARSAHRIAP